MKTIWKYELKIADEQVIEMPRHADVLSVQTQNDKAYLWAIVDSTVQTEERIFMIATTGNPFRNDVYRYKFLGTFQIHEVFVGHLFELYI